MSSPLRHSTLPRLGLLASLLCAPTAFAEVQAHDGYVRAVPPGHSISAAYLTLRNSADRAVQLNSARSDSAGTVELHQTREQDGIMRMRAAKQVEIAPGAQYRLQPGGDHLMLIDLRQPLNVGDKVNLSLSFSDGQQLQLTLPVRSPADETVMSGDNGTHKAHAEASEALHEHGTHTMPPEPAQSEQHEHDGSAHSH
ncbi:copper chaperone PCu(A)C [Marinobacterium rhizophilum]|uniref:Copper chaperone PCu(A)C n=1 Tax=Marinobacterium rhizophilum TaxID=420402 RepID=A0ABY5HMG1_9GAMM|nr:copper chaperone PCu(A)C [Marinobacterium rhizophilum]UTW13590.1 copper chaperone PCu(A)C [Marinobacterium rhizophilum]